MIEKIKLYAKTLQPLLEWLKENPNDKDFQRIDVNGIGILIHNKDSTLLNGIKLDYKDTLMGGGFQIENPSADRECGCGQSFG